MSDAGANERRLAAIVFTDVVGYSARMQRDETGTMALVRVDFERMRALCAQHGGEVLKSTGDGLLLCFSSVVQAVACGLQIQKEFGARPADTLQHRMGIHLGDVFRADGDVTGDGVNIAARMETKARPGTICLSQSVYDAVKGKVPMAVEPLGPQQFKNITEPIAVYLVTPAASVPAVALTIKSRAGWLAGAVLVIGAVLAVIFWPKPEPTAVPKPAATAPTAPMIADKSIAVLPFTNMSDDKDSGYFADGVHEDVLTHLAKIAALKVISRTSVMQYRDTKKTIGQIGRELGVAYVLEGSVRRMGNKVRITGQLIRAATDEHVWAQPYDGDLTDIFALQTELATKIANELQAVLTPQEKALIAVRPTANPEAYRLYLQARNLRITAAGSDNAAAIQPLLERAVQLDPSFAQAWADLSRLHIFRYFNHQGGATAELAAAKAALDRVTALAPGSPEEHLALGEYYYYGFRDYAKASEQYVRLLALVPGHAGGHYALGLLARRQNRWHEALDHLRRAHEIDPRNNEIGFALAITYEVGRYFRETFAVVLEMQQVAPDDVVFAEARAELQDRVDGTHKAGPDWFALLPPETRHAPRVRLMEKDWAWREGDARRVVQLLEEGLPETEQGSSTTALELATALLLLGEKERARPMLEDNVKRLGATVAQDPSNPDAWALLGLSLVRLGREQEGMAAVNRAVSLQPEAEDHTNGPARAAARAVGLAWAGQKDEALKEIARLVRTPFGILVEDLATSLEWTPLHGDPRFEAIVRDPANRAPKF